MMARKMHKKVWNSMPAKQTRKIHSEDVLLWLEVVEVHGEEVGDE